MADRTRDRNARDGAYRPVLTAALSAVVPGWGQWQEGRRRRGVALMVITLAVGVPVVVLMAVVFYIEGLDLAVDLARPFFEHPSLLLVLLAVNGVLLLFRVFAVIDAFVLARRGLSSRHWAEGVAPLAIAGVVLILVAVALPHGWVARRNLALYDLFNYDFAADPGQVTTTIPVTTLPPTTTSTTTAGAATTATSESPTTTTTTATTIPDPFDGFGRVNVLLMGGDAAPGRWGNRTDTMIVVSIDPQTGATAMFSIARNTARIPIPEGIPAYDAHWCHCFQGPANGIYQFGLENPDRFPGGPNTGGNASKAILGNLLGLEIHYFALVDMPGFVDVIDALGGVTITVTERILDPFYPGEDGTREILDLQPGIYDMDGHLALAYARSRKIGDDYTRMGRQRCVIEAVAEQADPIGLLRQLPDLVPAIKRSVITDIPVAAIPSFLDLLERADLETIPSIRFTWLAPELEGTSASYVARWVSSGPDSIVDPYPIPNVDLIRQTVTTAISLPPAEAIEVLNLQPIEETCG